MCGFLGVIGPAPFSEKELNFFRARSQRISSRGNTGRGEWHSPGVALFHYRLAFRGLDSGAQPMRDETNKRMLVYNGELYSFQELRERYPFPYATESDTEIFLAARENAGDAMLEALDGEYAFALWEESKDRLVLGRDPFGVKPIFFAADSWDDSSQFRIQRESYRFKVKGRISFASEMKGLPQPLAWEREGFQRQFSGLFEEIATPFRGVIQVPPGSLLIAELDRRSGGWDCRIERKIARTRKHARVKNFHFDRAAEELRGLIGNSVRDRLDSEVPLGAYLSGGVDSRIIAYEMVRAGYSFPSFTVGFEGEGYDESEEVRSFIGAHPGIEGKLLRLTDDSLSYSYPHAIYASELVQPYTNGAAKWWLSRFARRTVRGVLTGDGADELFCGYPSYRYAAWWDFYQRSPSEFRGSLYKDRLGKKSDTPWVSGISSGSDGSDLLISQRVLGWAHPLFQQVSSLLNYLEGDDIAAERWLEERRESLAGSGEGESALLQWQNYFLRTHFPTHVLNWVGDRMEMANTLEGRPPFLARAILEFMRGLPDQALVRGMRDKAIQRKAYASELKEWARAPKKQFNAPLFYAGSLGERYLGKDSLARAGLVDPKSVERAKADAKSARSPLARANAELFLQSTLVAHMLDEYLVRGIEPQRDFDHEENFMDERGESLS